MRPAQGSGELVRVRHFQPRRPARGFAFTETAGLDAGVNDGAGDGAILVGRIWQRLSEKGWRQPQEQGQPSADGGQGQDRLPTAAPDESGFLETASRPSGDNAGECGRFIRNPCYLPMRMNEAQ